MIPIERRSIFGQFAQQLRLPFQEFSSRGLDEFLGFSGGSRDTSETSSFYHPVPSGDAPGPDYVHQSEFLWMNPYPGFDYHLLYDDLSPGPEFPGQ